ncbi:putative ribonuclease H-like domain-containing protein [Tanacetum coccineum]
MRPIIAECNLIQYRSYEYSIKKIFKYLKGQPKLGLWYPRDSPFVLDAYSDSDYAGSHGDRKSTTGGCQFLGKRLISWQCKKQTIVATSSTEAEYVAAANCCGQFWSKASLRAPEFRPYKLISATSDRTPYTTLKTQLGCHFNWVMDGGDHMPLLAAMLPPAQAAIADALAIAIICLTEGRRFLQMILEIEPKNTKQYHAFKLTSKMFANMRLNFQGDHMPLLGTMLPPCSSCYCRPTTSTSGAPVNEPGPSSDPHIASSSRPHEFAPDQFTSTNVEDETIGALSTLVSTLVQKVNTQESELNAHKLLFKEVVGKLVKKVKLLEDKLKGRKRKFVMTDSDKEEDAEQDVDPLIKLAKAAATAAAASAVPTGGSHEADIPPSSSIPSDEFAGGSAVPAGATTGPSADPSNKGKSPLLEEDPPVRERTFRQQEEDRLGEEAARRMYEEEQAELEREREEMQRKRQQDVLNSAKYYTDSDWNDIMSQVHANQGLTADLLGPDVNEDNFAERMVALIAKRRREFAAQRFQDKRNKPMTYAQQKAYMRTFVKNQSSTIYTTGWTMKHVKSFFDDQLKTEFDKIRAAVAELKSLNIKRSLKRPGADLEQASSKKSKPTEAPQSSVPDESQQPSVEVPSQKATKEDVEVPSNTASTAQHTASSLKKDGTRKKRLGRKGVHISHSTIPIEDGDPEAEHKMCIKYASDADSASDDDTPVNLHAVVDWELLPTGLGWVNVIYRKDNSRKCFSRLREILHLVTRTDLMIIYGRVMTFYQDKKATGVGLVLWGDLKVLIDSPEVNDGSDVWKNQHTWIIQSWKLYSSTGIHVLETVSGLVVHMFVDKKYPLSVNLIERMLDHQLEICRDTVGNELTTAVQLIAFLKKQISNSRRPKVHDCYHTIHVSCGDLVAVYDFDSDFFVAGFESFEGCFWSVLDGSPFGGGSSRGQRQRRGEDVVHPLKVSLEYLYNGTSKMLYLSRSVLYSKCKGKGSKSGASMKCACYQGSGMKGTGETINDKDRRTQCKGEKVVLEKKVLEVHVEKRIQNEQKKRVPLYPFEAVYEVLHFYVVTLLIFQFFLVTDDMKLLDGWLFSVDILAHSTDA